MINNNRIGLVAKVLLLLFIIALIATASIYLSQIGAKAEQLFGPPSANLSAWQKIRMSFQLGSQGEALLESGNNEVIISLNISSGESIDSILETLRAKGLVQDIALFRTYLLYSGLDRNIQAGEFELSSNLSAIDIAAALLDATPNELTLSILAGWRIEEIAESLASAGFLIDAEDFLSQSYASSDDFDFLADIPPGQNLEGYFIAGNYEFERDIDAASLVRELLLGSEALLSADLIGRFRELGLNLHEALTLASIIEREAVIGEEMPLIASVFLNRVAKSIRLEADPTVQYAHGFDEESQSWWVNPITREHLRIQSPYNSYESDGLPPGPIASPSMAAITALAYPDESPYFFFQAACDGSGRHVFAVSFEEHLQNNCP